MLDHLGRRKILGGTAMMRLMIAGGAYILLALIFMFNHGAHMR